MEKRMRELKVTFAIKPEDMDEFPSRCLMRYQKAQFEQIQPIPYGTPMGQVSTPDTPPPGDKSEWGTDFSAYEAGEYDAELKKRIAKAVSSKTRSEWTKIFSGTDACVTPVLSIDESFNDSHHLHRKTFTKVGDYNQPSPSPRFSSSSLDLPNLAHPAGADNDEIFAKFNLDPSKFK